MDDQVDHSQVERFKEMARMMECDDDEQRFKERVGKLAKVRPKKPE